MHPLFQIPIKTLLEIIMVSILPKWQSRDFLKLLYPGRVFTLLGPQPWTEGDEGQVSVGNLSQPLLPFLPRVSQLNGLVVSR